MGVRGDSRLLDRLNERHAGRSKEIAYRLTRKRKLLKRIGWSFTI